MSDDKKGMLSDSATLRRIDLADVIWFAAASVPKADRDKSLTIRIGVVMFMVAGAAALVVALLTHAR